MAASQVGQQPCDAVVTVWGRAYLNLLAEVVIPSLLAPGNLPEFARRRQITYTVYTTPEGRDFLQARPEWAWLGDVAPQEINVLWRKDPADPMESHLAFGKAVTRARARNHSMFLMPPDTVWANGSLSNIEQRLAAGKRVVFMVHPRVAMETAVPALCALREGAGNKALTIGPQEMVRLSRVHMDLYTASSLSTSRRFPRHLEEIVWPSPDGYIFNTFELNPFVIDPGYFGVVPDDFAIRQPADPRDMDFITESDDAVALSLNPFASNFAQYAQLRRCTVGAVARWRQRWRSAASQSFAVHPFSYRTSATLGTVRLPPAGALRSSAEVQAAADLMEICTGLVDEGLQRAAQYIAIGIETAGLQRSWRPALPCELLAPVDRALPTLDGQVGRNLVASAGTLRRMLAAHVRAARNVGGPLPAGAKPVGAPFSIGNYRIQAIDRPVVPLLRAT